ncbi:9803_t:CDS:2, partial [Cetraspora pellucida]
ASSALTSSAPSPDATTNPVPIPDALSLILSSQKVVNLTATIFPPSSLSSSSVVPRFFVPSALSLLIVLSKSAIKKTLYIILEIEESVNFEHQASTGEDFLPLDESSNDLRLLDLIG